MAFLETGESLKPATSMCRSAQASFLSKKQIQLRSPSRSVFFPIAKQKGNQEHRARLEQLARHGDCPEPDLKPSPTTASRAQ